MDNEILVKLDELKAGQDGLRQDVNELKTGQDGLRQDVNGLKTGQDGLRQDVRLLRGGQGGIREDLEKLQQHVDVAHRDLLEAVGQSHEIVTEATQALAASVRDLRSRVEGLERKVS